MNTWQKVCIYFAGVLLLAILSRRQLKVGHPKLYPYTGTTNEDIVIFSLFCLMSWFFLPGFLATYGFGGGNKGGDWRNKRIY